MGGEGDEAPTEEKSSTNETIKSKVYVKDKAIIFF